MRGLDVVEIDNYWGRPKTRVTWYDSFLSEANGHTQSKTYQYPREGWSLKRFRPCMELLEEEVHGKGMRAPELPV